MANLNSLLFLFTTIAPNMEPPDKYPATLDGPPYSMINPPLDSPNAPKSTQLICGDIVESFSCKFHCQKNCSNYEDVIPCPDICVFGCTCIDPFIRGPNGKCIMPRECPDTPVTPETTDEPDDIDCPIDEEASYFPHCQKNCTNYDRMIICPGFGERGCVCKSPLIRGPEGNCIMSEECPVIQQNTQDICSLPKDSGRCLGYFLFWYFDSSMNKCRPFVYGGCGGNENRFPTALECVHRCVKKAPQKTTEELDDIDCPVDEEASYFPHCQKNCTNYDRMITCLGYGERGCVCKSPLIRGPEGNCIMPEKCPVIQQSTQDICSQPKDTGPCRGYFQFWYFDNYLNTCRPFVYGGCHGNENRFRTFTACMHRCKKAPKASFIPEYNCKFPEVLGCQSSCERNCTNFVEEEPCSDPEICIPGCTCADPFVRGPDGSCIMPYECPETSLTQDSMFPGFGCGDRETFGCHCHCQIDCSNYNKVNIPCPIICVLGCVCKEEYIKGPDGSCILPDECPAIEVTTELNDIIQSSSQSCRSDEELVRHTAHCAKTCDTYMDDTPCSNLFSVTGCVCKLPKIRGPDGSCVLPQHCPNLQRISQNLNDEERNVTSCPPDEEMSCFSHCQVNCTTYKNHKACPIYCVQGCVCKPPMIRGPDGSCIWPQQCPALLEMSQNSESDENSDNDVQFIVPPFINMTYVPCDGENEILRLCPRVCPDSCFNYMDKYRPCKFMCLPFPKCECRDGYVRGPFEKCIKKEECPTSNTCPENEEYNKCGTPCQKDCENYDTAIPCVKMCIPGCFCKEDMVRDADGKCILKEECPARNEIRQTCPENEEYKKCGTACQKDCQNYDKDVPCVAKCVSGCFCKEPMVRGADGKCILKEECPAHHELLRIRTPANRRFLPDFPKFTCKKNEKFSFCAPMCADDCSNYKEDRRCKHLCMPGCMCIEGYVKNKEGACIKKEECEEKTCPENEEYKECGTACQKDCQNYDKDTPCVDKCVPGCFCKEPMVRGADGKCILKEECPTQYEETCPENEEYNECATACEKDCQNYDTDIPCEKMCVPGCLCKDPMVRDADGKCILKEECPTRNEIRHTCPENEEYNECGTACEKDCQNYDTDIPCVQMCVPGCFCKEGMVRGADGKCILKEECPAQHEETCPENEEYKECGTACQKNCQNYDEDIPCEEMCVPGCFCKEDMVRGVDGKCILKEECPAHNEIILSSVSCPENEEYKICGPACQENCQNYDRPFVSPCEFKCEPGCFCKKPMVRGPSGKCVHKDQCPAKSSQFGQIRTPENQRFFPEFPKFTCNENEEFSFCAPICADDCSNYKEDRRCKHLCMPRCMCIEGYVKNKEGACIKKEECEERSQSF